MVVGTHYHIVLIKWSKIAMVKEMINLCHFLNVILTEGKGKYQTTFPPCGSCKSLNNNVNYSLIYNVTLKKDSILLKE
jgi:hypothetical protein